MESNTDIIRCTCLCEEREIDIILVHVYPPSPLSAGEQDQLADVLARMFEEFSKSPDLELPPAPPTPALDPSSLSSDYNTVLQQLGQLVKS